MYGWLVGRMVGWLPEWLVVVWLGGGAMSLCASRQVAEW